MRPVCPFGAGTLRFATRPWRMPLYGLGIMEADDKIRGKNGVVISLRELPDGKLRVVVDVEKESEAATEPWEHKFFVTHKDYEKIELRKIEFPEKELADFGYFVLARLIAASGKTI